MTPSRMTKVYLVVLVLGLLFSYSVIAPHQIDSAGLTSAKDTLQTARLSINARVDATGTSTGGSVVLIKTSASAPSNTISTANLRSGDSVVIGANTYTVTSITSASTFEVTPVLIGGDTADNTVIQLKMKPQHVVTFNTASAVPNGFFQVLLPADATTPNDGAVDDQGWDFGGGTVSVTAAASPTTGFTFVTGVATASGGAGCTAPANYHCFEVHYSGNGAIGTAITFTIGNTNGTNTPISPNPGPAHTQATADTYTTIIKQFATLANPNTATPIDQTNGKVALIEAVRVTASVDPTITFSIAGVASAQTRCGVSTSIDTSTGTNAPLAVPFSTLSLNTFANAAQTLTVSTNAASGYAVTAIENDQLGKDGGTTPFIPDTPCDTGPCTNTTSKEWNTATNNGFGYAIQLGTAATASATYAGYNELTRTFSALQFPATIESEPPEQVMGSSTIANAETATVCYRISVGATQAAGNYENQVTYTATATF